MTFKKNLLLIALGFLLFSEGKGFCSQGAIEELDRQEAYNRRKTALELEHKDIKETERWLFVYSNAGGILDILSTLGTATTTILVAISAATKGGGIIEALENDECPTCSSTLDIAAASVGAASLACNVLAKSAQKAAESRKKHLKKLTKVHKKAPRKAAIQNHFVDEEILAE